MKILTAFVVGTAAGAYGLVTSEGGNQNFLIFVSVLFLFSLGTLVALTVYLDKETKD
jgi:hypothetical protein